MRRPGILAAAAALGLAVLAASPALADCTEIDAGIRAALAEGDVKVYGALHDAMQAEPTCDAGYRDRVGRTLARSALLQVPVDAPPERIAALLRFGRPWQVLVALGDAWHDREAWTQAVQAYEEALDDMRNVAANPKPPPEAVERRVYKRAVEARALAPDFVATRSFRGRKSGLASPEFRNFTIESVPVPVRFAFDSDALTPAGVAAVEDIHAYLAQSYPDYVAIIGHTDPVGSDAYNLDLSKRRAEAVAAYLVGLGYRGVIVTIGRGESEPFIPDDPSKYGEDQLHAFDRRVEYRLTR